MTPTLVKLQFLRRNCPVNRGSTVTVLCWLWRIFKHQHHQLHQGWSLKILFIILIMGISHREADIHLRLDIPYAIFLLWGIMELSFTAQWEILNIFLKKKRKVYKNLDIIKLMGDTTYGWSSIIEVNEQMYYWFL